MLKKFVVTFLCFISVISFSACGGSSNSAQVSKENDNAQQISSEEEKLKVSVTFDAMKELVAAVGKDKVDVSVIIPAGMEPHDFEPKAQDLAGLGLAKLFIYNGIGMEEWAEEAIAAVDNKELIIVEASKGADMIENEDEQHDDEDHDDDEDNDGHHHGKYDPHLWLSLKGAETEAKNIKDGLVQADPLNKEYYEQNCDEFILQIEKLYNEYSEKFQTVTNKNFVTGHAAFGYLCRDFGLEQNSVADLFAEGEPTAQQLSNLVEYCKTNKVTTIFAEEMSSADVSQTLANEVGAKVETIYTIESAEDNMTYLERMESNLTKIYESIK